jgi:MFS transporter, ACS family, D-galactonate transporter
MKDRPADLPAPFADGAVPGRWGVVGLLMAYSFMSWFNRVSMSVAGTERIMGQYGISPTEMGVVYSALLFAYAVCMTPGGWFIDRKGAWLSLVVMGLGSALFVALTGVVGLVIVTAGALWYALLVVRGLAGVFTAPIYPASARVVAHWLPLSQRALGNGLVNGAALVGIASTFVGFGALIDRFDWPGAFLITGAATGLLALVWLACASDYPAQRRWLPVLVPAVEAKRPPPAPEEHFQRGDEFHDAPPAPSPAAGHVPPLLAVPATGADTLRPSAVGWLSLLRNRSLVLLTVSYAAVGYFEYLFFFWTEYYFADVLHLGKDDSRLYATLLNLAMAAGMMLGGLVSDRLVRRWGLRAGRAAVPVGGLLISAAFLGVGIAVTEPWAIVACFAVAMACAGACEGPCWATAVELGGRHGGTAAGVFNTGGNLGGLLAPVVTPWVSARLGWPWGIALGAAACLVAVSFWLGIDPSERPRAPGRDDFAAQKGGAGA